MLRNQFLHGVCNAYENKRGGRGLVRKGLDGVREVASHLLVGQAVKFIDDGDEGMGPGHGKRDGQDRLRGNGFLNMLDEAGNNLLGLRPKTQALTFLDHGDLPQDLAPDGGKGIRVIAVDVGGHDFREPGRSYE